MDVEASREFEKDVKKLTARDRQRVEGIVKKLAASEKPGKQLHHLEDVFSVRIENKRLVYQIKRDKVILLFFKSREDVYDYLI